VRVKGCFVCKKGGRIDYLYGQGRREEISSLVEVCEETIDEENFARHRAFLRQCEVLFCGWDMVPFTGAQIEEYFPRLKVIFYAAGSVRYFARPFLERGVVVLSAWRQMAVPVAQFTVSLITLCNKGALMAMRAYQGSGYAAGKRLTEEVFPGAYHTKVGILGAGAIGSLVVKMLREMSVEVMVYDPFLTPERRKALGIERTHSLEEIFSACQTISCHIANNPRTVGMLDYDLFSRMGETAAFLNTGRGAQVVEADLVRALREQPLRSAVLDVTDPEPVAADSPLLALPNVFLFPHVAGYAAKEVMLFADKMILELDNYLHGRPLDGRVTLEMLETMA
jgi:phosphoglycerate dehydrogenase-like enzyme